MSRNEKGNTLKINGKEVPFKNSDAKLFRNLMNAANNLGRAFQKSGKITGGEVIDNMIESCLSIMLVLHDILTSSLDVRYHSVSRMTLASYSAKKNLLAVFNTAGSTGRTQTWERWEIMSAYGRLSLCHVKVMRRLNGAIISALRKATCNLEGRREKVNNLDNYLVEIIQVEENIRSLIDEAATLQLEKSQISLLHTLLERVNTLLERERPQS